MAENRSESLEVVGMATSGIRLVPKWIRPLLYKRQRFYWYWTLVRNARKGPAGELRTIRAHLRRTGDVRAPLRQALLLRIRWHLRNALDRPPRHLAERVTWDNSGWAIHDTTGYEDPVTEITFIPGIGSAGPDRGRQQGDSGRE